MTQKAILLTPEPAPELWLARAEQARRIALMLSAEHAAVLVAYASECEAAALAHMDAHQAAIAA